MIGIFDSGSGGLTVFKAIRAQAPTADIVYFGDLKNAPYGNKSREELGALTVLGVQKLLDEGATEIVSACNSVSVSIVLPMFDILDLPRANIVEMVGPTIASFRGSSARVLVLATKATIEGGVYQNSFRMLGVESQGVALPMLVSQIEEGASYEVMRNTVSEALRPYVHFECTHVLLGCTHFPLVRNVFEDVLAELAISGTIVDPAYAVAETVREKFSIQGEGKTHFILSQESAIFRHVANALAPSNTFTVVPPRQ
jgi:glutamate racemase